MISPIVNESAVFPLAGLNMLHTKNQVSADPSVFPNAVDLVRCYGAARSEDDKKFIGVADIQNRPYLTVADQSRNGLAFILLHPYGEGTADLALNRRGAARHRLSLTVEERGLNVRVTDPAQDGAALYSGVWPVISLQDMIGLARLRALPGEEPYFLYPIHNNMRTLPYRDKELGSISIPGGRTATVIYKTDGVPDAFPAKNMELRVVNPDGTSKTYSADAVGGLMRTARVRVEGGWIYFDTANHKVAPHIPNSLNLRFEAS